MNATEVITSDALMYLLTIIRNTRGTKLLPISWGGNLPVNEIVREYVKKSGYLKYMNTSSETGAAVATIKPSNNVSNGPTIIGVKNVTEDAGATTFIYMLKK